MRRAHRALGIWLAAASLLAGCDVGGEEADGEGAAEPEPPNLLVVMVDDQPASMFNGEVMPNTVELFEDEGSVFTDAIAAPPLCCPSRAGFITGRYAHNHGVVENDNGYALMRDPQATLPVALQAAGYRTAMIGKFMNGYEPVAGAEPAPGFDRWYAMYGYAGYTAFQVSDDGELRRVEEYATTDITDRALEFTSRAAGDDAPFFLWLSYNAPHTVLPGAASPCDGLNAQPPSTEAYERFADAPLPLPPSFDEGDVSDKPSLAGGPGPVKAGRLEDITRAWRCALAASWGVDSELARLTEALRESDELERTVVVYLSDNGHFYGEHRLSDDKRLPLEPALRIPLAIAVGSEVAEVAGGDSRDELVSQVDLAPTLLDYAGAAACPQGSGCPPMDGRSLRPLLEEGEEWPEDRAIPLELDDGWRYAALRTPSRLYVELDASRWQEFSPPAAELYDLNADPDELANLAAEDAQGTAELADRLAVLERCAGIEGRDEPVTGRPFCE